MSQKIKLKLECWWTDSGSLSHRFIRQFIPVKDLEKYEIVNNNPDYTIVFGKTDWDKLETTKKNTIYFSQEPVWAPSQPKDNIHNFCEKIFISDKEFYPFLPEYKEILLPMFYGGRGDLDYRDEWDWSQKMFTKDFSHEKTEIISSVVTNAWNSHLNYLSNPVKSRIIYKERTDLMNLICNNFSEVKLWGSFQENNGINFMGVAWNKLVSLRQFKFSICFENTIQKNYVSEKFWDCILTDTIPIYFGCSNIDEHISEEYFINMTENLDDNDFILDKISYIIHNSDELYQNYLPKIKELKSMFIHSDKFNLWEKIKKEII